MGRWSGLTQRSLEAGTARTLNSFVGWTEAFGGVLVRETHTGCRHEGGCVGAGRLLPQGPPGTPCPSAHPPPDAHPHSLEQRSPASGLWTSTSHQISGGIGLEIKCTVNVPPLNHPQTIPSPPVHGQTVFHEISPSYQKVGGLCPREAPLQRLPHPGHPSCHERNSPAPAVLGQ